MIAPTVSLVLHCLQATRTSSLFIAIYSVSVDVRKSCVLLVCDKGNSVGIRNRPRRMGLSRDWIARSGRIYSELDVQ
ncbi:hypothetical protein F5B21DRAFT_488054 [Xylaria acuta]|nr:hypothetical protein F5B21DRAFT_488054 [Xylaria acuta]